MALAKKPEAISTGYDKKYDHSNQQWGPRMRPWSIFRKRRLFLTTIVLLIVYLFIKYLPNDLPNVGQRIDSRTGLSQGPAFTLAGLAKKGSNNVKQLYDGPVKFYGLAASLQHHVVSEDHDRRGLVFLLHDLRTATSLIALACKTALHDRVDVHIAVVSPSDTLLADILAINAIKSSDCPVYWHDARPDHNALSSASRHVNAVTSAMSYLHAVLRPSAFIIDNSQLLNPSFHTALQDRANQLWTAFVKVPNNALVSMDWLAALDSSSYPLLNRDTIDIVITPYRNSAGSLMRLLDSIRNADYEGLSYPRITVELPPETDSFALQYLERYNWPLFSKDKLILRRRLDAARLTSAIASLRTLEAFYPSSKPLSHVLVLDPDVELSSNYFQYLSYLALEYKHGKIGERFSAALMGISLECPSDQPRLVSNLKSLNDPLFISHIPESKATLYFGDKWVALQDYVTLRLKHDPELKESAPETAKLYRYAPTWLRLASELMQARNYVMLYPSFSHDADTGLVITHNELHQTPEEFAEAFVNSQTSSNSPIIVPALSEDTVLIGNVGSTTAHSQRKHGNLAMHHRPIRAMMGLEDLQPLPQDTDLPIFAADGSLVKREDARNMAERYADGLSVSIGGCESIKDRDESKLGTMDYLFCK